MMKITLLLLSLAAAFRFVPFASADVVQEHRAWVSSLTSSHRRELQDAALTPQTFLGDFCPSLAAKVEAAKDGTVCRCTAVSKTLSLRCTLPQECVTGSEFAVSFAEVCGNSTSLTCFQFIFAETFGTNGTVIAFTDTVKFDDAQSAVDYEDVSFAVTTANKCDIKFRYNESQYACNSCETCDGNGGYIIDCTNIQNGANLTTCGSLFSVFSLCPARGSFTPSSKPIVVAFCFSGDTEAIVMREDTTKQAVPMKDLKLGDMIQVDGEDKFEPIYSFGHYALDQEATFLAISTSKQQVLELSPQHMLFLANASAPIAASMIRKGHILKTVHPEGEEAVVTSVKTVSRASGVFAPFTKSGTIVVNKGIVASTYIAYQDQSEYFMIGSYQTPFTHQWVAHTFTSVHRMLLAHVFGNDTRETYEEGISRWVKGAHESGEWLLKQQAWLVAMILVPSLAFATIVSMVEQCIATTDTTMMKMVVVVMVGALTLCGGAIMEHYRNQKKKANV